MLRYRTRSDEIRMRYGIAEINKWIQKGKYNGKKYRMTESRTVTVRIARDRLSNETGSKTPAKKIVR